MSHWYLVRQVGGWRSPEERDQALARRRSWDGSAEAPGRSVLRSGSQPFPASHPRPWSVECDCGRRGCARAVAAHCFRLFPSFWKPRRDASSHGIRTTGTLAVVHFVIGSLTDSQSISVTTVAGKGRRGHDNRVFLLCQDSECAWSRT